MLSTYFAYSLPPRCALGHSHHVDKWVEFCGNHSDGIPAPPDSKAGKQQFCLLNVRDRMALWNEHFLPPVHMPPLDEQKFNQLSC